MLTSHIFSIQTENTLVVHFPKSRSQSNSRSRVEAWHWLWGSRKPERLNFGIPIVVDMLQNLNKKKTEVDSANSNAALFCKQT